MLRTSFVMLAAIGGLALSAIGTSPVEAQGTNPQEATLVLTEVDGACTPSKPDVTISRSVSPRGLKWIVDNQCTAEAEVEVFDFEAVAVGVCVAPANSKPFKEDSRKEKVKQKEKKPFGRNFTLGNHDGCWTYKVKLTIAGKSTTFDPQIRIDR